MTVLAARACETEAATDEPGGPGAHLGKLLGISTADGRRILDASTHLHTAPLVREQLLAGALSPLQAAAIIEARQAASRCPAPPRSRTAARRTKSPRGRRSRRTRTRRHRRRRRRRGRTPTRSKRTWSAPRLSRRSAGSGTTSERHKAAARGPDQARHLHDSRYWRQRRFADGGVGGEYKLPPEAAARLHAMMEAETEQTLRPGPPRRYPRTPRGLRRRRAVRPRRPTRHRLMPNGSRRSGAEFMVRVDLAALRRGEVEPVRCARSPAAARCPSPRPGGCSGDSLLNLVIHDGVDIRTVVCGGRRASKALAVAIWERDPYCVDCGSAFRLEKDHQEPVSLNGETSYWNIKNRCPTLPRPQNPGRSPQNHPRRPNPRRPSPTNKPTRQQPPPNNSSPPAPTHHDRTAAWPRYCFGSDVVGLRTTMPRPGPRRRITAVYLNLVTTLSRPRRKVTS